MKLFKLFNFLFRFLSNNEKTLFFSAANLTQSEYKRKKKRTFYEFKITLIS